MDRTKMFWSAIGLAFGSLLLLGFVAPPGGGGNLTTTRAQSVSEDSAAQTAEASEGPEQYTCADGVTREMGVTVDATQFTATGELTAITENGMVVRALPAKVVLAPPMEGSISHGYLAGDVVTTSGFIADDGSFRALTIGPACAPAAVTELTTAATVAPVIAPLIAQESSATVIPPESTPTGLEVIAVDLSSADEDDAAEEPDDRGDKPHKPKHDKHDDDDDEREEDDD